MLKVGHRGASAHAPENTYSSFDQALAMGCDGIEFDVHQCASGELVVIHDKTLERTTNGTGNVMSKTWDELARLDAGGGEKLPRFTEMLRRYKNLATLFIETKTKTDAAARQLADDIHQAVHDGWEPQRLVVISFHPDVLHWVRLAAPEIPLGLNYEDDVLKDLKHTIETMKFQYLNPYIKLLDKDVVAYARSKSMKVVTWCAYSKKDVARAESLGVDGIMVDDPVLFSGA
jgi:glycerophosphoryl diester phosphodiesterase